MYPRFLLLFIIVAISFAVSTQSARLREDEMMMEEHEKWIARHGRIYQNKEEKAARFKVFKDNVKFINDFNRAGNHTFKMGINKFSDLTSEEFLAKYASGIAEKRSSKHLLDDFDYSPPDYPSPAYSPPDYPSPPPPDYSSPGYSPPAPGSFMYADVNVADLPSSLDWREKGAVTPIKLQGECGCCWAFSTVAAIEGIHKIKTGNLISLSEQQLVDCAGFPDTCRLGGIMDEAFSYVAQNGGIASESDYPYNAYQDYYCNPVTPSVRISSYEEVPTDEDSLLKAVANQPVSITLCATLLQHYHSGVLQTTGEYEQYTSPINHGLVVIGYGYDEEYGLKYWLLKNSWGTGLGEDGYFRLQKDSGLAQGTAGMLTQNPLFPVI